MIYLEAVRLTRALALALLVLLTSCAGIPQQDQPHQLPESQTLPDAPVPQETETEPGKIPEPQTAEDPAGRLDAAMYKLSTAQTRFTAAGTLAWDFAEGADPPVLPKNSLLFARFTQEIAGIRIESSLELQPRSPVPAPATAQVDTDADTDANGVPTTVPNTTVEFEFRLVPGEPAPFALFAAQASIRLVAGDTVSGTWQTAIAAAEAAKPEVRPLIVPGMYLDSSFGELPPPLGKQSPVLASYVPPEAGLRFAEGAIDLTELLESASSTRVLYPGDTAILRNAFIRGGFLLLVPPVGEQHTAGASGSDGGASSAKITPILWRIYPGESLSKSGAGSSLPVNGPVAPGAKLVVAPVLGADAYEFLSGGANIWGDARPGLQRGPEPEFELNGLSSVVFAAVRQGRPLVEASYNFSGIYAFPALAPDTEGHFAGRVLATELTNVDGLALFQLLVARGVAELRPARGGAGYDYVDPFTGERLLGMGLLDEGRQLGLYTDSGVAGIVPGYERHPLAGLTLAGAQRLAWLLTSLATPAAVADPLADPLPGSWRLPTAAEYRRLALPLQFPRVPGDGAFFNFAQSGDPFEDPTFPYNRNNGPTTPVAFFPPDSPTGAYDVWGNVWEWVLDDSTRTPQPGPLTGRVAGGSWNISAPVVDPYAGESAPILVESRRPDLTSWQIGARFVWTGGLAPHAEGEPAAPAAEPGTLPEVVPETRPAPIDPSTGSG